MFLFIVYALNLLELLEGGEKNYQIDMLIVYGEARCNAGRTEQIYRGKFPNRRHPSQLIVAAEEHILERVETVVSLQVYPVDTF